MHSWIASSLALLAMTVANSYANTAISRIGTHCSTAHTQLEAAIGAARLLSKP
jgi:hypothetical protein